MTTTESVRTPDVNEKLLNVLLADKRELTDDEIARLLENIKPVVRGEDDQLYYIAPIDPKKVSFIWGPHLTNKATDLGEIAKIYTLHTWGYFGFFKPSLEEVLSMIPQRMIEIVKAFEIIGPDDAHDLNRQSSAISAGYQVAVTILYGDISSSTD